MAKPSLKLPRNRVERERMVKVIRGLSASAKCEFFQKADEWAATVSSGRKVIGVLNHRYDLCGFECDRPAPWFAAAFDTQTGELLVCREFPRGRQLECRACAAACAKALDESLKHLKCY